MRQKSIGEVLRVARESRGWNFTELQRMTKIQAKYLQALEYNDFEMIPDQQYTRSFLERYAQVLELDTDVLLDAYDTNSLVGYYEAGGTQDFGFEWSRRDKVRQKRNSYLPLLSLLLVACAILVFVTYVVHSRIKNQAVTQSTSSYSVVSSTSTSTMQDEIKISTSSSLSKTSSTATVTTTGTGGALAVSVKQVQKPIVLILSVKDTTSWVSVSNTDLAYGTTLSPENKTVTVTIPEEVEQTSIVLGVVQGVSIEVAGQKLDLSQLTSQTGKITLTIEE